MVAQKMFSLEIRAPARDEILEIARLHKKLFWPQAAREITDSLRNSLQRLQTHPYVGISLEEKELCGQGYRKLICGNYLCFYRLVDDVVFIYHIADGRTEYKHLFRALPRDMIDS